ncbi:50S ribosomal protein L44e [Candidatus Micrarchaeota archaeon]|jgi:large subunit ribosomal protein L44e|nr:50S ribosomal protein L44e [Candidatus Micrarchaeota archaeon]
MEHPKEVRTYCPKCKKYTKHKVKLAAKGSRDRTLAKGNRKHKRKLEGYGGKRRGKKVPRKQAKPQKIVLACDECKKKHERIVGSRTKKKLELIAKT